MKSSEIGALITEAKSMGVGEFGKRHPLIAFAVETSAEPEREEGDAPRESGGVTMRFSRASVREQLDEPARSSAIKIYWPAKADQGVFRVGRDTASDIVLTHPRVSKRHVVIQRVEGQRGWIVKDEGSSNGTTLNTRSLGRGEIALLDDGDRVVLGKAVVVVPLFTPSSLYQFVRGADAGVGALRASKRLDMNSLVRAITSLGFATEGGKIEFKVRSSSPEAPTEVRVTAERNVVAVEWGRGGVFLDRRTVGLNDPKAPDSLRQFLVEAILAWSPTTADTEGPPGASDTLRIDGSEVF